LHGVDGADGADPSCGDGIGLWKWMNVATLPVSRTFICFPGKNSATGACAASLWPLRFPCYVRFDFPFLCTRDFKHKSINRFHIAKFILP